MPAFFLRLLLVTECYRDCDNYGLQRFPVVLNIISFNQPSAAGKGHLVFQGVRFSQL